MMNHFSKIIVLLVVAAGLHSCKKDPEESCVAGTGGTIRVAAFPKHHSKPVRPYALWLKFNTRNQPGTTESAYDLVVKADTTEDHVHIPNLRCGDYYVYMTGFDTAGPYIVRGGIPYSIPKNAAGEIIIDVPVTE